MAPPVALVLPIDDPALLDYRRRALAVRDEAAAFLVDSPEKKTEATAFLGRVARLTKDAEAKRTEMVKPFNEHVKGINDLFKQTLAPVLQADQTIRSKVLSFDVEERKRAQEAARLAAEAAAKAERERLEREALLKEAEKAEAAGNAGVAEGLLGVAIAKEEAAQTSTAVASTLATQAAAPARTTVAETGASATVRKTWAFKVVDLGQVSRDWLMLDERKVREAIRAGEREIAGLEIYQEESLSVRA